MPLLPFRLKNGVRSDPAVSGEATEFCTDAVNFFSSQEGIVKRSGMQPLHDVFNGAVAGDVAFTVEAANLSGASLPATAPTAMSPGPQTSADAVVAWFEFTAAPSKVRFTWETETTAATVPVRPRFYIWDDANAVLVEVAGCDTTQPAYDSSIAGGGFSVGTMRASCGDVAGLAQPFFQDVSFELSFGDAFNTNTGGGVFAVAMVWDGPDAPVGTITVVEGQIIATPATLATTAFIPSMRTVCLQTWTDRAGAPHTFAVFMQRATDPESGFTPVFWLDGAVLAQVGDIAGALSMPVDQKIEAFYHPASDRLLGHIVNGAWFYVIPGDGNVYQLEAFSQSGTVEAALNPFASDPNGLRATMPQVSTAVIHDGRVFAAKGELLLWSAPDAYPDTWPNQNERFLSDGGGPITDLCSLGGALLVAKRNALYLVQPTGDPQGYDAAIVSSGVGAIGRITPCGPFALIAADDGLYVFDGSSTSKVSDQLDRAFLSGHVGNLDRTLGVFFTPLSQWRMFYPSTENSVCDRALYVDLEGWTPNSAGEGKSSMGVWPQGPYETQDTDEPAHDPGFLVTAVCEDSTGPRRRILVGNALGGIFEMDVETLDFGTHVKARAVQAPINLGTAHGLMVARVKTTMEVDSDRSIQIGVIPNGYTDYERTCDASVSREPGYSTNGAFQSTFTAWDASGFRSFTSPVTRFPDFATRVQTLQTTVRDEGEGQLTVVTLALDMAQGSARR